MAPRTGGPYWIVDDDGKTLKGPFERLEQAKAALEEGPFLRAGAYLVQALVDILAQNDPY